MLMISDIQASPATECIYTAIRLNGLMIIPSRRPGLVGTVFTATSIKLGAISALQSIRKDSAPFYTDTAFI